MRTLFIGGPGRSGTSFVADRLARHAGVCAFRGVELKLFTEKNGLLDLWHALGERYSPNRAIVAVQQFRKMTDALVAGQYGQPALSTLAPAEVWRGAFGEFVDELLRSGHPQPATSRAFAAATRRLVVRLKSLADDCDPRGTNPEVFLEKTPHALLALDFLDAIAPAACFVHVMRDPRSIAHSLLGMRWGPDTPENCASWVASYCSAWVLTELKAADLGLSIHRVHIEAIAHDPVAASKGICTAIGLAPEPGLFSGASPDVLNGWAINADPATLSLLDQRLKGWIEHFGYAPGQIGGHETLTPPRDAAEMTAASSGDSGDLLPA